MTQAFTADPHGGGPTRRGLLRGAAAAGTLGVAGIALSSCGGDASDGNGRSAAQASDGGAAVTAKAAEIPTGGGKVFDSQKVVVTQPARGEFKAFTAVCTHQGCIVAEVADGTINCPCHGSKFSITDGAVQTGPATKPLTEKQVTLNGDDIAIS